MDNKKYRVKKILNNNVVLATRGFQEFIVVGLGIGHQLKPSNVIKPEKIEKVFALEQEDLVKTLQLVQEMPKEKFLELYQLIDTAVKESDISINEHAYITMIDHINFAIERHQRQQDIRNFMIADLKILYQEEYQVSETILNSINAQYNISLPIDEVGFLTVHIVDGRDPTHRNQSSIITDTVLDCLNIVRDSYLISLKPEELATQRIMIHLKMLIQRVVSGQQIDNKEVILYNVINEFKSAYSCALKIQNYIENRLKSKINSQEIVYLTIHLNRIETLNRSQQGL